MNFDFNIIIKRLNIFGRYNKFCHVTCILHKSDNIFYINDSVCSCQNYIIFIKTLVHFLKQGAKVGIPKGTSNFLRTCPELWWKCRFVFGVWFRRFSGFYGVVLKAYILADKNTLRICPPKHFADMSAKTLCGYVRQKLF